GLIDGLQGARSGHSKRPLLGTALVQSRALARILGLVRSAVSTAAIRPGYPANLVVKRSELDDRSRPSLLFGRDSRSLLDAEGCRLNWSHLCERNTGRDSMMRIPDLALTTITLMWLAVLLPTNPAVAQERLVFRVSAENTQYTQQHTIDVGDVAGHQVR